MGISKSKKQIKPSGKQRIDVIFAVSLFIISCSLIVLTNSEQQDAPFSSNNWLLYLSFLIFTLLTISMGFSHPNRANLSNLGHVSFDRIAQISAILILGPYPAALINGVASFIYPWHRLLKKEPITRVAMASFFNSGLMSLCVLLSGLTYQYFSGKVPITLFGINNLLPLILMIIVFEVIHEVGMRFIILSRGGKPSQHFNSFSVLINLGTGICGIFVALIYNTSVFSFFLLLVFLVILTMIAIKQLARIRFNLEKIVHRRTFQLEQKSVKLKEQANRDPLTKLHNRRYITHYLEQHILLAKRGNQPLSIAIIDIDYFKSVNDNFSHAIGDEVLIQISEILLSNSRKTDAISRYGGEEFLLVFPSTSLEKSTWHCENLRKDIESHDWRPLLGNRGITVSIGLASLDQQSNFKQLLDQADNYLYQAKHQGRNKVLAFGTE